MAVVTQAALGAGRSAGFPGSGRASSRAFWCGGLLTVLGAFGDPRRVGRGVHRRQARRRGLPDLSRCASACGRARTSRIQHNADASTIAEGRDMEDGLHHQPAQPQDRRLLHRTVCRNWFRQGWPTGTVACRCWCSSTQRSPSCGSVAYVVLLSRARSTFEKPRVRQALERINRNSSF